MWSSHFPETPPAGSLFSSSVHPSESTVHTQPHSPLAETPTLPGPLIETFRHSHWRPRRQKIYDALTDAHVSWRRRMAFAECGSSWWVMQNTTDDHKFKCTPDFCHDRFCAPCAQARAAVIRTNLANYVTDHPHRFITLTVRSLDESLQVLLDRLLSSFRRLRRSALWRDRVLGGAAFIELTCNPGTGSWHPHLHLIVEGRYMAKCDLRQAWLVASGDSHIVDIRLIREPRDVIRYVAQYATKALPTPVLDNPDLLLEAVLALEGRKLAYTFGTWHKWPLLAKPTDGEWKTYCHLNDLLFGPPGDTPTGMQLAELLKRTLNRSDPQTVIVDLDHDPPTQEH